MDKGEGPDDWNKCEPWGEKAEVNKYIILNKRN